MTKKTYLGDSVYVELVIDDMIKLTTENGIRATNTIFLEHQVFHNLLGFLAQVDAERERENDA